MTNAPSSQPPPPVFATPVEAMHYYYRRLNLVEDGLGIATVKQAAEDIWWPRVMELVDMELKAMGAVHKPTPDQRRISFEARDELHWAEYKSRMPGRYIEDAQDALKLGVNVPAWVARDAGTMEAA